MNKNTNVLLQRLKNNQFTALLTFIGLIIGLISYTLSKGVKVWYVQYTFQTTEFENLPSKLRTDTVFTFSNITVRNFSTSKADTMQNDGVNCHELKVYTQANQTKDELIDITEGLLEDQADIHAVIPSTTIKNRRAILYYGLAGFVIGMLLDLFRSRKTETPSKNIKSGDTA